MNYQIRAHRRRRLRPVGLARARFRQSRHEASRSPRARPTSLRPWRRKPAPRPIACDASRPRAGRQIIRRARRGEGCARRRRLQRQLSHARAVHRARPGRGGKVDRGHRLRRLPGGASRGQAHAAAAGTARSCSPARPPASRAMRSRRRSPWASSRCAAWRRAWRANCRRRASTSRISSSTAASAASAARCRPTSRTRCSIPTPSPQATCTSCSSRAAPGRRNSNCGPGWRSSKPSANKPDHDVPVDEGLRRARAHHAGVVQIGRAEHQRRADENAENETHAGLPERVETSIAQNMPSFEIGNIPMLSQTLASRTLE